MKRTSSQLEGGGGVIHCVKRVVAVVWPFNSGFILAMYSDSEITRSWRLVCWDSIVKSVAVKGCE